MLLEVSNLLVSYPESTLYPMSFALDVGEMPTIIGGPGSGKTTLVRAIACLSESEAQVSGQVYLNGRELLAVDERACRPLCMKESALSFQNSAEWFNPPLILAGHLQEVLYWAHREVAMATRMEELMALMSLETADPERYPRELSGDVVQKFLLANALALNLALVLLDEPTGALDITFSWGITALIQELNRRLGTAFLVITHDMKLAADLEGRTVVPYDEHVEEAGDTRAFLDHPRHPYTRGLLQSVVGLNPVRDMWGIRPTTIPYTRQSRGYPFYDRCTQSLPDCTTHTPEPETQPDRWPLACNRGGVLTLLECWGLRKSLGRQRVLDDIDLTPYSGEIVSLVGRSGAGKTTPIRTLVGLFPLEGDGAVEFQGEVVDFAAPHRRLGGAQTVFQDSQATLSPRMTVRVAVEEPMRLSGCLREGTTKRALEDVGLFTYDSFLIRRTHALSGGQRQWVAVARALAMESAFLLADEPTSMLDPSGKANLLQMLKGLQNSQGFSMLFITHYLDSALKISDRTFRLEGEKLARPNPNDHIRVHFDGLFDAVQSPLPDAGGVCRKQRPMPQKGRTNMEQQVLWEKCVAFHGYARGGLTIGFQATWYAMELLELGFPADEDVVCTAENDACGVDAIQVPLGHSAGKGNLLFHLRGKQAFPFYNRKTGEVVRLVLRPTPVEYQTKEEHFRYLQNVAPASFSDVKPAVLSLPERTRLFQSHSYDGCGEMTAEHLLRLENGKRLCLDCSQAYNRFDA